MNPLQTNQLPFEKLSRIVVVKKEASGDFGIDPGNRSVEQLLDYGIVNIDKPRGPTQQDELYKRYVGDLIRLQTMLKKY